MLMFTIVSLGMIALVIIDQQQRAIERRVRVRTDERLRRETRK